MLIVKTGNVIGFNPVEADEISAGLFAKLIDCEPVFFTVTEIFSMLLKQVVPATGAKRAVTAKSVGTINQL